mmetsp:Transcript_17637/g.48444  ORF Transcript_17637/g.48444 Transcript_17637/m.48444 type:complete len:261 (+) Transcript_17637:404-1186(+)
MSFILPQLLKTSKISASVASYGKFLTKSRRFPTRSETFGPTSADGGFATSILRYRPFFPTSMPSRARALSLAARFANPTCAKPRNRPLSCQVGARTSVTSPHRSMKCSRTLSLVQSYGTPSTNTVQSSAFAAPVWAPSGVGASQGVSTSGFPSAFFFFFFDFSNGKVSTPLSRRSFWSPATAVDAPSAAFLFRGPSAPGASATGDVALCAAPNESPAVGTRRFFFRFGGAGATASSGPASSAAAVGFASRLRFFTGAIVA